MKPIVATALHILLVGVVHAEIGDTEKQAIYKYGNPIGVVRNGKALVNIYDSPYGRITETYDKDGICIESDASKVIPPEVVLTVPEPEQEPDVEENATGDVAVVAEDAAISEEKVPVPPQVAKEKQPVAEHPLPLVEKPVVLQKPSGDAPAKTITKRQRIIYGSGIALGLLFVVSIAGILIGLIKRIEQEEQLAKSKIMDLLDEASPASTEDTEADSSKERTA